MKTSPHFKSICFSASVMVGAVGGLLEGLAGGHPNLLPLLIFQGVLYVIIAGFLGGFTGVFIRNAVIAAFGGSPRQRDESESALAFGILAGSLLGFLVHFSGGGLDTITFGTAAGSFLGSLFSALPGNRNTLPSLRMKREH